MPMWKYTIALIGSLAITTPAAAYSLPNASTMHSYCQSRRGAEQVIMMFYVQGILDQAIRSVSGLAWELRAANRAADLDKALEAARKRLSFCVPDKVNNDVIERAFCSHLAAHPEKHQGPAYEAFIAAMTETWPCQ